MKRKLSELSFKMPRARREGLDELRDSIKQVGLVQPIVINQAGHIISGKRRAVAARNAGLVDVPVVVSRRKAIEDRIAELDANLCVLPVGEAEFDEMLAERKQLSDQVNKRAGFANATAKRLKVSKRTVEKGLARARAAPQVKKARMSGLSSSKVDELVKLKPADQNRMLGFAQSHDVGLVKRVVREAKKIGVKKAIRHVQLVDPVRELSALLDSTETLLRDMTAGRIPFEIEPGDPVLDSARGVQLLLKHFVGAHKRESTRRLRAVA